MPTYCLLFSHVLLFPKILRWWQFFWENTFGCWHVWMFYLRWQSMTTEAFIRDWFSHFIGFLELSGPGCCIEYTQLTMKLCALHLRLKPKFWFGQTKSKATPRHLEIEEVSCWTNLLMFLWMSCRVCELRVTGAIDYHQCDPIQSRLLAFDFSRRCNFST